jgi:hypothetical protein
MNDYINTGTITNHAQLQLRIAELRMYKSIQEEELKVTLRDAFTTLNIISIFKNTSEDQPIQLAKSAVNMTLDLIIDLVLGKHRSIRGFISSIVVERFTNSLVDNNLINVISTITELIHRFKKRNNDSE